MGRPGAKNLSYIPASRILRKGNTPGLFNRRPGRELWEKHFLEPGPWGGGGGGGGAALPLPFEVDAGSPAQQETGREGQVAPSKSMSYGEFK